MSLEDIYQLTVDGTLHGQKILNVFHYRQFTDHPLDRSDALADAFEGVVKVPYLACLSNEYSLNGFSVQKVWPLPVLAAYQKAFVAVPGAIAADSLPTSVAVVIKKKTALAGPSHRGRIYLAGIPKTHEDNSMVTGAGTNLHNALADALSNNLVGIGGPGFAPILWNRDTHIATQIEDFEATTTLRNQRRRQVGRGI